MFSIRLIAITVFVLAGCQSEEPTPATPAEIALSDLPARYTFSELRQWQQENGARTQQLLDSVLARVKERSDLNAFITVDETRVAGAVAALAFSARQDSGVFGMPLAVKDNIHVADLPNTGGTPSLRNFVPVVSNTVVQRLEDAGAIIVGKANLHELAFGITSDNSAFGAVRNPVDPTLFAGGSSGGTAAAIAAGLVSAGLGTDTGGSARVPAALTGIVGFRPSTGRYPSSAVTPISHTRDTIGVLANSVADIRSIDSVITNDDHSDGGPAIADIRLGVPRVYFYQGLDASLSPVVDAALARIQAAGIELIDVGVPGLESLMQRTAFPIALYEVERDLPQYLQEFQTGVTMSELVAGASSPDVVGVLQLVTGNNRIPEVVYQDALAAREELRAVYAALFFEQRLDALIFPTTILPARPIENSMETVELNGEQVPTFPTYIRNTDPASIAGLPSISLPAGATADGLPVGMELDAAEGADVALLGLAELIEAILAN